MQIYIPNFSINVSNILYFVIATLLVIISLYLLSTRKNNKNKEDKKGLLSWVEIKDFVYWLLITSLGAISTITYQYSGDKSALDHWSFAGTIVSIILAVVAIGFTLFQTLSSNLSSEKITNAAVKIEKASNTLDSSDLREAGSIISKVSEEFLSYHEKLQSQFNKIEEEIKSVRTDQEEQFSRFNDHFTKEKENGDFLSKDLITVTEFIEEIYVKLPIFPRFFVYALSRFQEEGFSIDRKFQTEFMKGLIEATDSKSLIVTESMVDYALGNFTSIKVWINILFRGKEEWIPNNVMKAIKEKGVEVLEGKDKDLARDYLEEFIKTMKSNK